jgi:hypothetical protein
MQSRTRSVSVERIEDYNALHMNWQTFVSYYDVRRSFQEITTALDKTASPTYVVVNLQPRPRMPLSETINSALHIHNHPLFAGWLVVSPTMAHDITGSLARIIEHSLIAMTGRRNIHWFRSEAEALAYIRARTVRAAFEGQAWANTAEAVSAAVGGN